MANNEKRPTATDQEISEASVDTGKIEIIAGTAFHPNGNTTGIKDAGKAKISKNGISVLFGSLNESEKMTVWCALRLHSNLTHDEVSNELGHKISSDSVMQLRRHHPEFQYYPDRFVRIVAWDGTAIARRNRAKKKESKTVVV